MQEPGVSKPFYPNFNMVRLIAASMVIFSHAFLISEKTSANEPFMRLLGEGNNLGKFGVYVFFITSGFLVTQSAQFGSVGAFLWRRALRIYPALVVCTLLSVYVLGPLFSPLGISGYLLSSFHLRTTVYSVLNPNYGMELPNVQFYDSAISWLATFINGSLWTISQEIFCYLILAGLMAIGLLRAPFVAITLAVGVTWALFFDDPWPDTKLITDFTFIAPYFFGGSLLWFVMEKWRPNIVLALIFVALGVLFHVFWPKYLYGPMLFAVPLVSIATSPTIRLPTLERVGDVSYGTYLYGWPVEQVVNHALGQYSTPWTVFALSLPTSLLFGWLSWHLLEKRALRLKRASFLQRQPISP
ncbi:MULTISPECIES: acyltransferase family protein [Rhizobium]|uniref:acyltransferase family protein n=1 Tax=Rhizobium phaseoli TaxID=396 RepID=UPI0004D52AA0|nr:acyltransferase [Rhizobium phaseoli]ANL33706.1 acyltransferase 3 family protein [Rhizobium phaseoli]ANL97433.1 acyltransferase 3 family protein [Rhizobium phaseoli]KEC75139.1 acetyltransferase [Rhizobium leguminosarum bv. phaseoli CCGM1]PWI54899.1 acyltransferase [Rhizobium phaseoli]